jgi:hypothetical protein
MRCSHMPPLVEHQQKERHLPVTLRARHGPRRGKFQAEPSIVSDQLSTM